MIYKYSEYVINEGSSSSESLIYWSNQLQMLLNRDWTEISSKKYKDNLYYIHFKAGNDKYDYYKVLVEKGDIYYMEENENVNPINDFQKKLNEEFWKTPQSYFKDLKYSPKCLGDISHLSHADKYNI